MNRRLAWAASIVLLLLTGCAQQAQSQIGVVDIQRIVQHWPKFLNYQNQLNADVAAIQQSKASADVKQRQMDDVQRQFTANQTELTNDVRDAATQVAANKHLRFVLTREFVGYGGVDITSDVEKLLQIDDKSSP